MRIIYWGRYLLLFPVLTVLYWLFAFVRIPKTFEPQRHTIGLASGPSTLADFLSSSKEQYLQDARNGSGKAKEWTVVMGNEAG
ncbi:uncharacterized protein C8R40DRAFT_1152736, partial [Lentinula edodes]|uniref:uncharacterized protein n=1 Tax=Lentinula edodes TaxID=5353 RepID=UPI001E8E663C